MNDNKPEPVWLMRDKATMATIQGLRRQGITTAADIARALNNQGIATPMGDRWHAMQVQRIITMGPTRAPKPSPR
jgi:Recombinase